MLMENRDEIGNGSENVDKSKSLDRQMYNGRPWVSSAKKLSSGSGVSRSSGLKRILDSPGRNGDKKKRKKEVLLNSLSSGKKNKISAGQVVKSKSSSAPVESNNGDMGMVRDGNGNEVGVSLGGISLKLNGDVNIPKRPRDFVRRKKVEADVISKQEGVSGSSACFIGKEGKLNGDGEGDLHHHSQNDGKSGSNGDGKGAFSEGDTTKVKKKKTSDSQKDNRTNKSELIQSVKREKSHSSVNRGDLLMKKPKRNWKKTKEMRSADVSLSKEVEQSFNEARKTNAESQDDEENLEANAAMMLSSRFDPSCTGFSSGGKSSTTPFANGSSAVNSPDSKLDTARAISLEECDVASTDGEARALRSSNQQKGNGSLKKRQYFYEVLSQDLDSYWALNRRIKVFWPLDESWYYGHVIAYDSEKKLHHVKYDDREEEWIDLHNESFKLLLLPSEVPGRVPRKQSATRNKLSGEGKSTGTANKEHTSCNNIESEPIISWLGRSTFHKLPPVGKRKKQKTLNDTANIALSSACEGKGQLMESLEVGPSGQDADNLVAGSAMLVNPGTSTSEVKIPEQKNVSSYNCSPIVYFRKRFQKKSQQPSDIRLEDLRQLPTELPVCGTTSEIPVSYDLGLDMLQSMLDSGYSDTSPNSEELIWDTDGSGRLVLITSVTSLKVFRCELSLPFPVVDVSLFRGHDLMFTLQHWALIPVWPMIRLEMMFVDDTVGFRVFLFEGCMMKAVSFIFLVLIVFQSNQKESNGGQQLPATSIQFRFCGLQSLGKQRVFTFYNFSEVASSKWSYLDRKLSKHCVLSKQLLPSACTYNNILALGNVCQLPLASVSCKHPSATSGQRRSRQQKTSDTVKQSSSVMLSQLMSDSDEKLPPVVSFTAAPSIFISVHLKLLMEQSISSSSILDQDSVCQMDCLEGSERVSGADRLIGEDIPMNSSVSADFSARALLKSKAGLISSRGDDVLSADNDEVTAKPSSSSCDDPENEVEIKSDNKLLSPVNTEVVCGPKGKMTVTIPSLISNGSVLDAQRQSGQYPNESAVVSNDDAMCSPTLTPQSFYKGSRTCEFSPSSSACLSPGWSDRKQDFLRNGFGNGPKKPRTQVSYSMPLGGPDHNPNNKFYNGKSFSSKRIRKASEKRTSEAFGSLKRNVESLSCDANVLVTVGDCGWRECGATVVLEPVDQSEWKLAVKISGETKYSHKAHQCLHPGITNRYTLAMIWKGGKEWMLEFPDRSQWIIFKEMLEECCNRNLRAASVKNIPIPGVHLIEENDDTMPKVPYMRPSSKYYRQIETDVDIAMNPSRVLYDMDSDDDEWVMKRRGLDFNECGCGNVSDEAFEKIMDAFENLAYAKQNEHFSLDELEEAMASFGPLDAIIVIYKHWREKRQRKGMPLIRHLQPPQWERYQQQVKEWEQIVPRNNPAPYNGISEKSSTVEKPAMFAFCLKPRGLEVHSRGSKHRPQKKLHVGVLSNGIPADPDSFHPLVGRRLNGDDRLVYPTHSQGVSDSSPVLQGSTRVFSPRYAGGMGSFSLNNDSFERNYYSKPHRNKSKRLSFMPPSNDQFVSYSPRGLDNRNTGHMWNSGSYDAIERHSFDQVGPSELNEFRLRDAASAARHAAKIAKMKRENAQRMLCRADLAMHKAVAAIMTAEAVKASYEDPNDDDQSSE